MHFYSIVCGPLKGSKEESTNVGVSDSWVFLECGWEVVTVELVMIIFVLRIITTKN